MHNPPEEIGLLPTDQSKQHRNESEVLRRLENASDNEHHRNFIQR